MTTIIVEYSDSCEVKYNDFESIRNYDYVTSIHCTKLPDRLPSKLKSFSCTYIGLTEFNLDLPDSLETLILSNNYLESLPPLPKSLKLLGVSCNRFKQLPKLPDSLESLSVDNNYLTSLDISNTKLRYLKCDKNYLTECPIIPSLKYVNISINNLKNVPTEAISVIGEVRYDGNPIDQP